jgi:hypothetical protein
MLFVVPAWALPYRFRMGKMKACIAPKSPSCIRAGICSASAAQNRQHNSFPSAC